MTAKQILESGTEMSRGTKTANGHVLDGGRHEADPFPKRLTAAEKHSTPALTSSERKQWQQALKTIEKGWISFVQVGVAIEKIRRSRLYREDYDSWEVFCRDVLGISRTEANRQIIDAKVVSDLQAPIGATSGAELPLPTRRSHVRALARLESTEQQGEAWRQAQEAAAAAGHPVTAKLVEAAVDTISGTPAPPSAKSSAPLAGKKSATSIPSPAAPMDVLGRLQAARRSEDWALVDEVIEHLETQGHILNY
ncbi:MAG: hypothetical protein ACI9K5_002521 [Gammaproteobacteria bacterium]|jgi:hypothetical protein